MTSITIPEGLTSIGYSAFFGCSSLTGIIIPRGVISIGDLAFRSCSSLKSVTIPEGMISIGSGLFLDCRSLTSITIPDGVTSIGAKAFYDCNALTSITIPGSVTSIGDDAFCLCIRLLEITNMSDLTFTIGSESNGYIAKYAKVVIDKNGNKTYFGDYDGFTYFDTADGFRFMQEETGAPYKLIAYLGQDDVVTIPLNFNGQGYDIYEMRGVKNVVIPNGITKIDDYAFYGCSSLTSIAIPEGVTSIGNYAFGDCHSLTSIAIPEGVTSIGGFAFYGCSSFTSITIPKTVTTIGTYAFSRCENLTSVVILDGVTRIDQFAFSYCKNLVNIEVSDTISYLGYSLFEYTGYYNDRTNWENGCLYLGRYFIAADKDIEYVDIKPDTICIADGAFAGCKSLKSLSIGLSHQGLLMGVTNLETLILTNIPTEHIINGYFNWNAPLTLKNVVIKKGCLVNSEHLFTGITSVNIYVEDQKIATQWDHDYPGWNNGNKVYYGGEWINAEFKDANEKILSSDYYTVNQVIRQPFVADIPNGKTKFVFVGWDIDGDGIADGVPATSTHNISVTAVMKEVDNECVINFYDYFGNLYDTKTYVYGETIVLPENPVKKGYVFNGWRGYEVGAVATESMDYYSVWSHEGDGHNYDIVTVEPTCEEQGYDRHVCSICDDEYRDNYVVASGHQFGDWIIDEEATCAENGLRHHICLVCNASVSEEISAHGHEYIVDGKTDASCSHQGKKVYVCSYCGNTVEETTPVLAHEYEKKYASKSWIEWLIDRLLNMFFGYEGNDAFYYRCVNCGHIQTMEESSNSATAAGTCEHELGDWKVSVAPSCLDGVSVRECAKCGKVIEAKVLDANGEHVYDEWVVTKNATCTNSGLEQRNCKNCSHYETRELKALGHDYSTEWTEDSVPTCTSAGSKSHHCTRCDDKADITVVEALGHRYGEWKETKAPTCTATGTEERECSVCHNKETRTIDALGHSNATAVVENKVEPTCTADGHYDSVVYCSVCHEELSREQKTLPQLGHDMGNWQQIQAPTCTENGKQRRDCTRCDHYEMRTINALGHVDGEVVVENMVEPDCITEGHYDNVIYCTRCNVELSKERKTISALGHSLVHHEAKAATCTDIGWEAYDTCERCERLNTYKEIPAKGHVEAVDEAVAATCTETGLTEGKHCSICHEILKAQEVIPALGHDYGEWTTVKDPTVNESGEEERVCKICNYCEQRENPPLGIGAFKTAVADLDGKKNQDLFDALKTAIELYNNLSDENKQLVQEDYQKLKAVIVSYNENILAQNAEFETANETALYMFVANLSILAAIVYILKRKLL